ncbi:MAG: RidA family protein [Gemmatimonadota bacterium]|jgi:enamine deaminase RidA (YjgF/YER057c/UK114 family)|nr:MAG: RidA family protein [Gemmatimonadota bacterium]
MGLRIINPEELGAPKGFSHGVLGPSAGRVLFVAGQNASRGEHGVEPAIRTHFVRQFAVALERVLAVVREAGGKPADIGRMTIYTTDMQAYLSSRPALGIAYRSAMGSHYPAMALVEVSDLVDEGAIVEIEATAVLAEADANAPRGEDG